jgi:hypothetical protein
VPPSATCGWAKAGGTEGSVKKTNPKLLVIRVKIRKEIRREKNLLLGKILNMQ